MAKPVAIWVRVVRWTVYGSAAAFLLMIVLVTVWMSFASPGPSSPQVQPVRPIPPEYIFMGSAALILGAGLPLALPIHLARRGASDSRGWATLALVAAAIFIGLAVLAASGNRGDLPQLAGWLLIPAGAATAGAVIASIVHPGAARGAARDQG